MKYRIMAMEIILFLTKVIGAYLLLFSANVMVEFGVVYILDGEGLKSAACIAGGMLSYILTIILIFDKNSQ